ncbi:penicillin-binding protein activator LpoB [Aeromonas enteropelogenes]|uniref:penicillin-binding protein activator LpoB n=1 Tax=Aeromonas enteropelogenes TaxID=29489 RepID=UPI0039884BE8
MKMRPLLLLSVLLLGGCSVNPYRWPGSEPQTPAPSEPVTQPPVTQPEVKPPVQKPVAPTALAVAMADAFVQAPEVRELANGNPVLLLTPPQNGTGESLDTRPMAAAMIKRIQSKSEFRFVDPGLVAAITSQLEYQQGGVNPASLVRLGRQTGAGYMLYGDLVQQGGRYRLAMSLMDLRSGELLWNASRFASR